MSCGAETVKRYTEAELKAALEALDDTAKFGTVLRAKGIVAAEDGGFFHFDYIPGEGDVRRGSAAIIGRLCVIGAELEISALSALFGTPLY